MNKPYNIFVYADDILLASLTVTGLQKLVNNANTYITEHGLSFNPTKTKCITIGKCYLEEEPQLTLSGTHLRMYDSIDYLGAILSNDHKQHFEKRVKSCRQAFYGLQNAGLCESGVKPYTAAQMWKVALQPVMLYACQSVPESKSFMKIMDMTQAKLVKASLGLSKYLRTTPLLNALNIHKITKLIDIQSLNLLKSMLKNSSGAKYFYCNIMKHPSQRQYNSYIDNVYKICSNNDISLVKYMLNDTYCNDTKRDLKSMPQSDGLTDSIKMLMQSYSYYDKELVKMLLSPF